jgi:hypothetical protein
MVQAARDAAQARAHGLRDPSGFMSCRQRGLDVFSRDAGLRPKDDVGGDGDGVIVSGG